MRRMIASILLGMLPLLGATDAEPTMDQVYQVAKEGRLEDAQRLMDQVLHNHPNSSKAHFVRAELDARQGKRELAQSEFAKAGELDPGFSKENPHSVQALRERLGLPPAQSGADSQQRTSRIPLVHRGGTLLAPVVINGAIRLDFTVDSGASDVTIPADVFSTLVRTETITPADLRETRRYITATGDSHEAQTFIIKSLKVGDVTVSNVEASVAPAKGPLLLGQSFLKRFKNWSIDNSTQELILLR